MRSTLPLVICLDMEPDEREVARELEDWRGFPLTWAFFDDLRVRLARATGAAVRYSWFLRMDEQVAQAYGSARWATERYRPIIEKMRAAGDEIGLHVHAWRWNTAEKRWVSDFADQPWIDQAVRQGVRAFEAAFERPCRSFRFGDRWMNDATIDLLDRLGVAFDLTVEAGRKGEFPSYAVGSIPDYSDAPHRPYQPSMADFRMAGATGSRRRLWQIPISTVDLTDTFGVVPTMPGQALMRGARYEGYLDHVDQEWISGWAYDAARPDSPVSVNIYADRLCMGSCVADLVRPDLVAASKGSGAHGFRVRVPALWKDGRPRQITAQVSGTAVILRGSPRDIGWVPSAGPDDGWTMNLFNDSVLFGRAFDTLVEDPSVAHVALVLRSEALLDDVARGHVQRNVEHVIAHPSAADFVVTTPADALKLMRR